MTCSVTYTCHWIPIWNYSINENLTSQEKTYTGSGSRETEVKISKAKTETDVSCSKRKSDPGRKETEKGTVERKRGNWQTGNQNC